MDRRLAIHYIANEVQCCRHEAGACAGVRCWEKRARLQNKSAFAIEREAGRCRRMCVCVCVYYCRD